jgi:hypothetical protein
LTEEVGELNLGEAASRYLATLSTEERNSIQADINRFTRWFGSQKQSSGCVKDVGRKSSKLPGQHHLYQHAWLWMKYKIK